MVDQNSWEIEYGVGSDEDFDPVLYGLNNKGFNVGRQSWELTPNNIGSIAAEKCMLLSVRSGLKQRAGNFGREIEVKGGGGMLWDALLLFG